MKTTWLYLLLAGCSWGRFDDLKRDTGVGLAERPDGVTGNLGVAVGAVGTASADEAGAFVAAAAGPGGLVRYVIRANGDIEVTAGAEGTPQGGVLAPVKSTTPVQSIARLDNDHFVVGAPLGGNLIASFDNKIELTGTLLFPSPDDDQQVGSSVATGDLGLGDSRLDVATTSQIRVYVVADGVPGTATLCALRQPQPPSFSIGNNASAFTKNVAIATVGGVPKIIASGSDFSGSRSWVKIFSPPTTTDPNVECPAEGILIQDVANTNLAPFALAVGDADGNGVDLVTATLPVDSGAGVAASKVCLFLGLSTTTQASSCIDIPKPEDAGGLGITSSKRRGTRVLLANVDGAAGDEIIVSDPAATVNGKTAGIVAIYKLSGSSVTLLQTLFPLDADGTENFGRDLAAIPFKGTNTLLAVGMNDKVVVYFKPLTNSTDPRN
jgi:hypothetical protein